MEQLPPLGFLPSSLSFNCLLRMHFSCNSAKRGEDKGDIYGRSKVGCRGCTPVGTGSSGCTRPRAGGGTPPLPASPDPIRASSRGIGAHSQAEPPALAGVAAPRPARGNGGQEKTHPRAEKAPAAPALASFVPRTLRPSQRGIRAGTFHTPRTRTRAALAARHPHPPPETHRQSSQRSGIIFFIFGVQVPFDLGCFGAADSSRRRGRG